MTDYLALAMAQSESGPAAEDNISTEVVEEDFSRSGKGLLGTIFSRWKRWHPRPPEKTPEGGFRFPPSGLPLETTKEGMSRYPLFGNTPELFSLGKQAAEADFVAPPPHVPPGRYEVRQDGLPTFDRTTWGGFQGEGRRSAPPLVGESGGPGGERVETLSPWGFLRGAGRFFGSKESPRMMSLPQRQETLAIKNSPPGTFVSAGDEMVPDPALVREEWSPQETAILPLLHQMRQAQWNAGFVQGQRRQFTVTLPEAAPAVSPLSAEDFDLACERDARRYGGGFALY